MRVLKYLAISLLFLLCVNEASATHVAGGSLTYRCLGNSRYEISLEFRRDCFNGADDAQFDDFASVTIFNSNNQLMINLGSGGELRIPFIGDDTLETRLTSVCNVIGDDVCVQTTVYRDTVILPARPGGYILAYQRCCRNSALNNVADPLNTGATYWVRITERALQECNSSPVFENLPGVFICVNDTLRFDSRATDIDGDSLVYYLCTPSAGASEPEPMPQPSNPPPFEQIVWAPGFSENNMMGGSPISIDSETGQILAVPNQVGHFLIGVCVREFRDGVLLSEVRRDYEYAVRICGRDPIAGFVADENLKCDGLEIEFENLTTSNFLPIDSIEFSWTFDYPDGNFTSDEVNPVFEYPQAGLYIVEMIATDGMCFDTMYTTVGVAPDGDPTADFAWETYNCDGETVVQFYQTSLTSQNNPEHIWNIRYGSNTVTLFGEEPTLNIGEDQTIIVTYEIKTESGCNDVTAREIEVVTEEFEFEFEDKIICRGEDVEIFSSDMPDLDVEITPDIGILEDGMGGYFVENFSGSVQFTVSVSNGFCIEEGFVNISSDEEPDFPFNDVIQCGSDTVSLNPNGPDFYYYEWVGPGIQDPQSANPMVSLMQDGEYQVTVSTSEGSLCQFSDSLSVMISDVPEFELELSQIPVFCDGDTIQVAVDSLYPQIIWTNALGTVLSNQQEIVLTGLNDSLEVFVEVINENGCSARDSVLIRFSSLPVINVSGNSNTRVCKGEDAELQVVSLDSISWLDSDGNLLGTGFEFILEDVQEETSLTVVATNELGCEDSIQLNVGLHPDPDPDISPVDSLRICPGMLIPVLLDVDEEVQWFSVEGDLLAEGEEFLIEDIFSDTTFVLLFENSFGCQLDTTIQILVDESIIPEIELDILDSIQVCVQTDFNVQVISSDSVTWLDLDGNVLATGNDFSVENVEDTLFYQVLIIDEFNCQLRDTFQIDPFEGIDLEITSSSQEDFYCEGEALDIGTSTNINANIEWILNGDVIAEGDSLIQFFPDGDLELVAIAMDQFGCMSKDTFILRESQTEGEIIGDSLICILGNATLEYIPELMEDVFSIMWSPQEFILQDNGLEILVQLDTTQQFNVVYSNEDGCITLDSFVVDVSGFYDGVMAFASPDVIFLGESSELSTDQPNDYTYEWSPAETLDDAFSDTPIATPLQTTTYVVTVTDYFGCTDTAEVTVEVIQPNCDESDIFVPNAFTPNGDNLNDVFKAESNFIDEQRLLIYNRWGEEVYFSTDKNAAWDGTYEGKAAPSDVYGFRLEIVCINGFEYETQGNLTLFR